MQKNRRIHQAQIGAIAVILTTILLAIGVAISTRITREAAQEAERRESSKAFNLAEGGLETGSGANPLLSVSSITGDNTIQLGAGETVELALGTSKLPQIDWNINVNCNDPGVDGKHPALIISHYKNNELLSYEYVTGNGTSCDREGYVNSEVGTSPYKNKYENLGIEGGIVRIKALFSGTHLRIAGLTSITRSAAKDDFTGEQVRVVEQRQTEPAAPSVLDYALFAGEGNLSIEQGG